MLCFQPPNPPDHGPSKRGKVARRPGAVRAPSRSSLHRTSNLKTLPPRCHHPPAFCHCGPDCHSGAYYVFVSCVTRKGWCRRHTRLVHETSIKTEFLGIVSSIVTLYSTNLQTLLKWTHFFSICCTVVQNYVHDYSALLCDWRSRICHSVSMLCWAFVPYPAPPCSIAPRDIHTPDPVYTVLWTTAAFSLTLFLAFWSDWRVWSLQLLRLALPSKTGLQTFWII